MTVKTAPERDRPRNIKNKLVHLIHDVVPSHSCFRHRWINELGHSSATRRLHQHDDGRPWKLGISNCALGGDIGVRQNEEFPAGTDDMVDRLSVLARGGRAVLCITAKSDPLRSEMGHSR